MNDDLVQWLWFIAIFIVAACLVVRASQTPKRRAKRRRDRDGNGGTYMSSDTNGHNDGGGDGGGDGGD